MGATQVPSLLRRKRGTVTVTETEQGWTVLGEGQNGAFRMRLPRCRRCASGLYEARPVCPKIHTDSGPHGAAAASVHTINSGGRRVKHELAFCHGNHLERVSALVELVAKTYGRAG